MVIKSSKLIQPKYLSEFNCIGSACEDNCCIGWQVMIDKSTYQRYRKCPDRQLFHQMAKTVTRNRTSVNVDSYGKITSEADGRCPFLNAENLCAIQKKLSEEYLSVVCTTYPRFSNRVNNIQEKSLAMSCPEAARIALLNSSVMEFEEIEVADGIRNSNGITINTGDLNVTHRLHKYFWELRIFTITVLQDREYLLWQRLIILGMFYNKVNQVVADGKVHEISQLISNYANMMLEGLLKDEMQNIPNETTIQMELMKELTVDRISNDLNSKRFFECFTEFSHGIQYSVGDAKEQVGQRYTDAYVKYYQPYIADHEYIMENYLVNYVFKSMFPLHAQEEIFDNYVMMIVHYSMIKMLLIGMAGFHKENFNTDHVIKLIQSFAKTVEHSDGYLKYILKLLKSNNCTTMAYMAILIKN